MTGEVTKSCLRYSIIKFACKLTILCEGVGGGHPIALSLCRQLPDDIVGNIHFD